MKTRSSRKKFMQFSTNNRSKTPSRGSIECYESAEMPKMKDSHKDSGKFRQKPRKLKMNGSNTDFRIRRDNKEKPL